MNSKHHAIWAVVALLAAFFGILTWYLVFDKTPGEAPTPEIATTTPAAEVPTGPIGISENTRYYEVDAEYPASTPLRATAGSDADAAAVASLERFARERIAEFKSSNDLANITRQRAEDEMLTDGRTYAIGLEYTLHEGTKTITYVYQIYENTLGAHPNTYYRTFTFDRATGTELSLADLFTPGSNYLTRLSERTRAALPGIMAEMAGLSESDIDMAYIFDGTKADTASFQSFAIDGPNLIIIFPPYQVAPYVYGRIDVSIPLSELSSILRAQYRP